MCDPLLEASTCLGIFVENFKRSSNNEAFFFFFFLRVLFLESKFYVECLVLAVEILSKLDWLVTSFSVY